MAKADHQDDNYHVHAHISSIPTYVGVFVALLFFTGLTVAAYNVRLGSLNLAVAMIIATLKATLVCFFFMHMKYEKKFNVLFFLGSLLFVTVFLGYTANDTNYRAGVENEIYGARVDPATGKYAYGTATLIAEGETGRFVPIPGYVAEGEAPAAEAAGAVEDAVGDAAEAAGEAAETAAEAAGTAAEAVGEAAGTAAAAVGEAAGDAAAAA
ncbi:MAG: cytochrome C oxidase subunit IV family protein, partial [Myxococcota bacterium]